MGNTVPCPLCNNPDTVGDTDSPSGHCPRCGATWANYISISIKIGEEERMTNEEKEERYHDYKRGWLDGVNRPHPLSRVGTPEPKYTFEYERGFEEGRDSFCRAMKARFNALANTGLPPKPCPRCGCREGYNHECTRCSEKPTA